MTPSKAAVASDAGIAVERLRRFGRICAVDRQVELAQARERVLQSPGLDDASVDDAEDVDLVHVLAWQACLEMGASMVLPTLATLVLLGVGVEGVGVLMLIMHAVMLPAMLIAMLLRRDEHSCHHGSHRHVTA